MLGGVNRLILLICSTTSTVSMGSVSSHCVCVLPNFTVHSHAQLNSAAAQFWAERALISPLMEEGEEGGRRVRGAGGCCLCCRAEWQSSSSFSVIKPERGLFFPANYVEITKTIKHLVVILPLSRFPQYCDRLMHCGWTSAPRAEPAESWGQQRANRWIYNCAFSRRRSGDHCPSSAPLPRCSTPETTTYSEDTQTETGLDH